MSNTFIGTLGADPRTGTTHNGIKVASFRMAVTERRFDADRNEWIDGQTSWITVVAFRHLAEHVYESFKKGSRVIAVGQLRVSNWERDGQSGTNVELIASEIGQSVLFGSTYFAPAAPSGRAEGADLVERSLELAGVQA